MSKGTKSKGLVILMMCMGLVVAIYQVFATYQCNKYFFGWGTFWSVIGALAGGNIPFIGAIWGYMGAVKGWGIAEFWATIPVAISWLIHGYNYYLKRQEKQAAKVAEKAKEVEDSDK